MRWAAEHRLTRPNWPTRAWRSKRPCASTRRSGSITRRALADDELGGYAIPAGALGVLSPYTAHRDPAFWQEPECYDPERFSPERSAGRPRFAYFPFGGGPRLCIGNTFALSEAQVVLSQVASRYRLELMPGQSIEVEPGVTLRPKHGLQMAIKSR